MDEEPEPAMPNCVEITSETTRLDLKPRPFGGGELVLCLAVTECHTWLGIGGRSGRIRRPRRLSKNISLLGFGGGGGGGPDYLPSSGDDCRRLIGRMIKLCRRKEEEYRYLSPACWDKAVPSGIERALAVAGTCEAQVDISVRFEFVYSEQKALLLACVDNGNNGGGDSAAGWRNGDAPSSCPICFEEMSREAGEVTDLPGCTHGFHPWCIAAWFHKASTCPVCRRDQLLYLRPDYVHLHAVMTTSFDSVAV